MVDKESIQELINRMERVKKGCFKNPNPYYKLGQYPTEYQELKTKISELQKLINGKQ